MIAQALAVVLGYLLGSVPFGLVLTRAAGLGDVRRIGSGSIGATNVLRTGSKALAAGTVLLDGGKGTVAVLLGGWLAGADTALLAGFASVLGHAFPIWLGFKGGKSVATGIGVMLGAAWPVALGMGVVWLAVAVVFRISSLAGLTCFALSPVLALWFADTHTALLALVAAAVVFVRHQANISRLLAGTEPRIGAGK